MSAPSVDRSAGAADAPRLVVDSATGVEVSLRIAGPGARAFAFVVDWHIRSILFTAWYVVAALIYNRSWSLVPPPDGPDTAWFIYVVAPSAALYFLYHYVLEVLMHGRTPGKRMAGVRIVTREGNPPSVGALLTRNVFRIVDSFPVLYGVGLAMAFLTRDHVRIGDLAAGTVLVYDRAAQPPARPEHLSGSVLQGGLDAVSAEALDDLLRRWKELEPQARQRLARRLLERHSAGGDGAIEVPGDDQALRQRLERLARGESS